jgi:hypothetical protein
MKAYKQKSNCLQLYIYMIDISQLFLLYGMSTSKVFIKIAVKLWSSLILVKFTIHPFTKGKKERVKYIYGVSNIFFGSLILNHSILKIQNFKM